jgi:hypothetical protein
MALTALTVLSQTTSLRQSALRHSAIRRMTLSKPKNEIPIIMTNGEYYKTFFVRNLHIFVLS